MIANTSKRLLQLCENGLLSQVTYEDKLVSTLNSVLPNHVIAYEDILDMSITGKLGAYSIRIGKPPYSNVTNVTDKDITTTNMSVPEFLKGIKSAGGSVSSNLTSFYGI